MSTFPTYERQSVNMDESGTACIPWQSGWQVAETPRRWQQGRWFRPAETHLEILPRSSVHLDGRRRLTADMLWKKCNSHNPNNIRDNFPYLVEYEQRSRHSVATPEDRQHLDGSSTPMVVVVGAESEEEDGLEGVPGRILSHILLMAVRNTMRGEKSPTPYSFSASTKAWNQKRNEATLGRNVNFDFSMPRKKSLAAGPPAQSPSFRPWWSRSSQRPPWERPF